MNGITVASRRPCRFFAPLPFCTILVVAVAALALGACGGGGGGSSAGNPSTVGTAAAIAPGSTCSAGGEEIDYGIDDNGNGVLDEEEIDGTVIVCNGADGDDGQDGDDGADSTAGIGINEGTQAAPVSLTPETTHEATVAAAGTSYYSFTAGATTGFLIGLHETDSDLSWRLYSDAFVTEIASCDNHTAASGTELCVTPGLTSGHVYYLKVEELDNIPSLFGITVLKQFFMAANADGALFQIDPSNGAGTFMMATGLGEISSMVFDPDSGTLFVGTTSSAICLGCVHAVDLFSGEVSYVLRPNTSSSILYGMARRPSDGIIYVNEQDANRVYRFDPDTEIVENLGFGPGGSGRGMTFDASGTLYMAGGTSLYTVNQDTAERTLVAGITGLSSTTINSMATTADGVTYVLTASDEFAVLNLSTAVGNFQGGVYPSMDGLVFIGAAPE